MGSIVYEIIDYPGFLENYYNDDKKARNDLDKSRLKIFEEDLNADKLTDLITSVDYSSDERIVLIRAIENKITDESAKILAGKFQKNHNVEPELLLSICELLSKYQNQEVYDLFLKYISDDAINDDSVQNIIIDYFNNYE